MKQISVLVVLLSCWSICAAAEPAACNLKGQWKNDLGSNITIAAVSQNGVFSGTYLTAVSATNNTIVESPLIGYQQLDGSSFGYTVKWEFSSSITVFTGQCFITETGPVLKTMWLLRSESENIKDDWKQTRVGYNIFHKLPKILKVPNQK
ncbi:avidin-like [Hyla sarda]|uniref:avidin-like n=1 Tax=Hyla sarda TaxID=327740 RepID=UPI0024C3F1D0|nr:avidin-like [Hyla sarda]